MRWPLALVFLVLAGCGDWPDTGGAPLSRDTRPWPVLAPLSDVLGDSSTDEAETDETRRLVARAAALRARALLLRGDVSDQAEMEALRARLAR